MIMQKNEIITIIHNEKLKDGNRRMKLMKKQIMSAIMTLILALTLGSLSSNQVKAANAVIQEKQEIPEGYTPVYDIADLYAIRDDPEGSYILMNDIDMSEDTSQGGDYNCGTGWDAIETFGGTLDGNGHRIIGMHIFGEHASSAKVGLFETLDSQTIIKNLGITNLNIDISGSSYVGAIVGYVDAAGDILIENCYSEGSIVVQGSDISCHVGGLIGYSITGPWIFEIKNCYNACEIDCSNISGTHNVYIGGICGESHYRSDAVKPLIAQCYNAGNIKGNAQSQVGAICGEFYSGHSSYCEPYENCNYLKGTAVQGMGNDIDNSDCVALTEAQMKNSKVFTGYDFEKMWEIDPYCSYPYPQLKDNRMIKINSISLSKEPQKLIYKQGEAIQLDNAAIEITYEDGIKTSIALTQDMLSDYDMMQIGMQQVNVSYGGQETSFEIEVQEIPVSSITIPEELSIYRSRERQLVPIILPENASDKSVDWESSDPAVVSVDRDGLVKAKAAGTAVITATASSGLEAECAVTVLVPAVSIQISQTALNLKTGESRSITAQALPLESTDTVKWRSGNPAVADVYEGTVIAKNVGTAVITAYTDSGAQASCTVTVAGTSASQSNGSGNQQGGNPGTSSGSNADLIRKTASAKAKIKSAKNTSSKMIKIKLSGLNGFDGYQLQYGLKKNFRGAKTIAKKSSSITVKKLKVKKTYYVRARVYKRIAGNTYYGKWSGRKSVKIKK